MNAIGQPFARPDGHAKVTGAARYIADFSREGMLRAVFVTSPAASGQLVSVETNEADALPGVVCILTADDMPRFGDVPIPLIASRPPMQDAIIRFEGQPVAIALAETLEQAEAAVRRIRAHVEPGKIKRPARATRARRRPTAAICSTRRTSPRAIPPRISLVRRNGSTPTTPSRRAITIRWSLTPHWPGGRVTG